MNKYEPGQPAARNSDPSTSHLAARDPNVAKRASTDRATCLFEILDHPGQTSAEVAHSTGLERNAAARRLPELRTLGILYNGDDRICTRQKRKCMTWFPVQDPLDPLGHVKPEKPATTHENIETSSEGPLDDVLGISSFEL